MSLFKQIQILVTLLLLMTLTVVMKVNFDTSKVFTVKQLFNNGKNIANVLALSLSSKPSDEAFMETSINAMFDGGYFEEITLVGHDNAILYKRYEAVVIEGVPQMFIDLLRLHIPAAEAKVMSGWSILGTLHVKAHPGSSYLKLWETFKQLCLLFVVLGSAAITASYLILRYLLKSLVSIRHQAEAISNNEFIITSSVPNTTELKKVVLAMNTMVGKVQTIYNRQLEYLKNYQALNFRDSATGLYNRTFFVKQLKQYLDSENGKAHGQVILLSLQGMDAIKIPTCHPVLNAFYTDMAGILTKQSEHMPDAVSARLPRHEFAVILPNSERETGLHIAEELIVRFLDLLSQHPELAGVVDVYGGLASYDHNDDLKTVLSKTDYALSVAKSGQSGTLEAYQEEKRQVILGKFEWKTLIEDALSENRFVLTAQPVISDAGTLHNEIYVNLIDTQGARHRANYFMPMVTTLGLANKLDQYVLEKTALYLIEHADAVLAVNITTEFCNDRMAYMWLRQFLLSNRKLNKRLVFELHESTLIRHPDICLDIAGMFKGIGFGFGIDQFTMGEASLGLLNKLKPVYIKVEQDYVQDTGEGNIETALNALITLTDSLDIKLIVAKVENEEQKRRLTERNIHYFQGRGVAEIAPLEM